MLLSLTKIETTYNLLSKNNKILVIISSFLFLFIVWYGFLTRTMLKLEKNKKDVVVITKEVRVLKEQVGLLKTKNAANTVDPFAKEEATLKQSLVDISTKIASFRYQLVPSKKIFFNIRDMLSKNEHIKLLSLQYLPEELVKDTMSQPVYRSPVELSIQGNFLDILAYLKQIERSHSFIFWDEAKYTVTQYPSATLQLKFHVVTSEAGQENAADR